jgi:signal-transduction protein with cAMP-binding, CBS, and nucleotidyltransferase domain
MSAIVREPPVHSVESADLTEHRRIVRFFETEPMLRGMPATDLEALANMVEVRKFRRKHMVWHPKHALLGLEAAFGGGHRGTTAVAHEDIVLFAIDGRQFQQFLAAHATFSTRVAHALNVRLARAQQRMTELVYKTAHARLASLFLELAEVYGVRDSRGVIVNSKLTHREMATLIGTTRETVSFAVVDLRRDGIIENQGKRVVLLDQDALVALATGKDPRTANMAALASG